MPVCRGLTLSAQPSAQCCLPALSPAFRRLYERVWLTLILALNLGGDFWPDFLKEMLYVRVEAWRWEGTSTTAHLLSRWSPSLFLWLEWFSENKDQLVFKTFRQLPFSPRVKPVSVLWPTSCHSGPHPLSIGLFAARLWAAPLLLSGLLAAPGALLPRGLCSHWMLTPSSFWSSSNTTFPVQLFLTPCLKLWFPHPLPCPTVCIILLHCHLSYYKYHHYLQSYSANLLCL